MDTIGAEVGHKMRSAIKAKLLELDCYVDDELPDYIMVMVANRRSKSEMNEDLSLFLTTKTSAFVNWLHIVLKKLKEVTVTNPEVYKKAIKRKSSELPPDSKHDLRVKKEKSNNNKREESITDDLPLLLSNRKVVLSESIDDNFDIPLLSEVNATDNNEELQHLEDRIRNVKSRLGLLVDSDHEDEHLNIKAENDSFCKQVEDENEINTMAKMRSINLSNDEENELEKDTGKKPQHTRITFETNDKATSVRSRLGSPKERFRDNNSQEKKKSILSRLGKRIGSPEYRSRHRQRSSSRDRDSRRDRHRRERQKNRSTSPVVSEMREGIIGRIQSKVKVVKAPKTNITEEEEEEKLVAVPSLIKVKPRVIPRKAQPNKNLLMKAIADAQRSIAQTPKVGSREEKSDKEELMTKKYLEKQRAAQNHGREKRKYNKNRSPDEKQIKFRQNVSETEVSNQMRSNVSESSDDYNSDREYIPKPVKQTKSDVPSYVPSSKNNSESDSENIQLSPETTKQQFIITLDGIDGEMALLNKKLKSVPVKSRLDKKRSPSPIIFDKPKTNEIKSTRPDIPDKLPVVRSQLALKNKERCRYWPGCRQGNKCEFVHPSETCKTFPQCKFGNKCLFLHPVCKFGSSCTKRDCTYDHNKTPSSKLPLSSPMQTCKFFPNCVNALCPFLHPKPCKYGKYCKNTDCSFSHGFSNNLSWKSK